MRTGDFSMGVIVDMRQFLQNLKSNNINITYCKKFQTFAQKGQSCKLVAGALVQNYLYKTDRHSQEPLPLYKNHQHRDSLRKHAKKVIGSQVGEVYGAAQVKKIYNNRGYSADCYRIEDEKTYEQLIVNCVSQQQPVIMFFDVVNEQGSEQFGLPVLLNGAYEHAAAIIGYYYDAENQMQLLYSQWGKYFTASLHEAFLSTQQLPRDKQPEKFYKIPSLTTTSTSVTALKPKAKWENPEQSDTAKQLLSSGLATLWQSSPKFYRVSSPPHGLEGSLAGVLCVMRGDKQKILGLDAYEEYNCAKEKPAMVNKLK